MDRPELRFYMSSLNPGMTVFDVGAHVGWTTQLFADLVGPEGKVHAFEPASESFEILKRAIESSNYTQVVLNKLALADEQKDTELYLYERNYSAWCALADRPLHPKRGVDGKLIELKGKEPVKVDTLDSYCERKKILRIDLLKIDAEGAEQRVLLGARQMLKRRAIALCIFEAGGTIINMGNTPEEIKEYLESLDYKIRNLAAGQPIFPGWPERGTITYSMHVVAPKEWKK